MPRAYAGLFADIKALSRHGAFLCSKSSACWVANVCWRGKATSTNAKEIRALSSRQCAAQRTIVETSTVSRGGGIFKMRCPRSFSAGARRKGDSDFVILHRSILSGPVKAIIGTARISCGRIINERQRGRIFCAGGKIAAVMQGKVAKADCAPTMRRRAAHNAGEEKCWEL